MSLDYNGLPFRFNNLQGTINLEGERAVIRSLRGTSGGGTVNLSGFVTLVESPRFEVRADLSQVRVRYPPSFTSVLDGNLRLAGGVEQAQLQGELVVRQMVLNENINFISKIIESSNPLPEQPVSVTSPIASKIRLNVRVTSAPPVQLQTPNLRLVGDIDLRLQGTVANPVQVGSIHFLSGESVFRGNRYTLVRGDMNMTNPFRTQAYLDLEAQTRVQSYDLTLDISGPFDRLKFAYRSDPPLANTDILSLLALGYVKQEGAFSTAGGESHRQRRRLRDSLRSSLQPDDQPHSASVRGEPNQDRSQRGNARLRLRRSASPWSSRSRTISPSPMSPTLPIPSTGSSSSNGISATRFRCWESATRTEFSASNSVSAGASSSDGTGILPGTGLTHPHALRRADVPVATVAPDVILVGLPRIGIVIWEHCFRMRARREATERCPSG